MTADEELRAKALEMARENCSRFGGAYGRTINSLHEETEKMYQFLKGNPIPEKK